MTEDSLALAGLAVLGIVGLGLTLGIVLSVRARRTVNRLMEVWPVRGTVISAQRVESNVYFYAGGSSSSTSNWTPAPSQTYRPSRLVETIDYRTLEGTVRRGNPTFAEPGSVDRTGMEVDVHVDPERPERFIAPQGAPFRMGRAYAHVWLPLLFAIPFLSLFACVFPLLFGTGSPSR